MMTFFAIPVFSRARHDLGFENIVGNVTPTACGDSENGVPNHERPDTVSSV